MELSLIFAGLLCGVVLFLVLVLSFWLFLRKKGERVLDLEDWKKRAQKIVDEDKRQEAESAKKKELLRIEEEERIYRDRLAELQEKFSCHICGYLPQYPFYYKREVLDGETVSDVSWNRPGDLGKCKKCGKWACEDHIYRKICQKCAERL